MTGLRALLATCLHREAPQSILLCIGLCSAVLLPQGSLAQQAPIIYPAQGQTLERQSRDEGECRTWAQQQTGFNPYYSSPPRSTAPSGPQGDVVRGAAKGALLGTVGGAIGGDVGKGAAIGAGVGATAGLLGRARNQRAAADADQQAMANYNAQVQHYNRAFGTCMAGRGYTVN